MATSLTKRTLKDLPSKVTESGLSYRNDLMHDLVKVVKENDDPDVPTDAIVKGVAKVRFLVSHIDCHMSTYYVRIHKHRVSFSFDFELYNSDRIPSRIRISL